MIQVAFTDLLPGEVDSLYELSMAGRLPTIPKSCTDCGKCCHMWTPVDAGGRR